MLQSLLLAEDDHDIQLVAGLALRRAGFDVAVAANGAEALARVARERPDVILLDWMMPQVDGLETCTRLKADPATRDIPVIFLTARSQESEIQQGLRLGAIGYITKPFDALDLGRQVHQLLNGAAPATP
jgi:two-component system phosphate regulon response regulator PhoB